MLSALCSHPPAAAYSGNALCSALTSSGSPRPCGNALCSALTSSGSPRPCPRCRWLELLAERDRMKRFFRRLMNMELARSFSSWLSHLDDLAEQARMIGSDCV